MMACDPTHKGLFDMHCMFWNDRISLACPALIAQVRYLSKCRNQTWAQKRRKQMRNRWRKVFET